MNTQHDDRFDAAMRSTWRDAGAHLPGTLRMQLTPAMAAQRRIAQPARRAWWPAAGAFASLAVAVGVWMSPLLRAPQTGTDAPSAHVAAQALAAPATGSDTDAAGLLSRNPDFYAWLGSEEARSLAME